MAAKSHSGAPDGGSAPWSQHAPLSLNSKRRMLATPENDPLPNQTSRRRAIGTGEAVVKVTLIAIVVFSGRHHRDGVDGFVVQYGSDPQSSRSPRPFAFGNW
jgi:hypothetical protein